MTIIQKRNNKKERAETGPSPFSPRFLSKRVKNWLSHRDFLAKVKSFSTGRMGWMAHRKWKEIKQQPGTAGPGNMLGCCLLSFHFLWAIHPIRPALCYQSNLAPKVFKPLLLNTSNYVSCLFILDRPIANVLD